MANNISLPLLDDRQLHLFSELPEGGTQRRSAADSGRQFVAGDPNLISVSGIKLEEHLKQAEQKTPFIVSKLLDEQDWSIFEGRYAATGRAPYSPRLMMGLILYGVMQGVHSLRELERLARLELGCMWVAGGIRPDHTNIGRFIAMHHDSLTQEFFEALTRSILKAIGSNNNRLAGDGTVIEAACSHYKLLKEEALRARLEQAKQQQEKKPDDTAVKAELAGIEQCLEVFEQRKAARVSRGKDPEALRISPQEPEAMVQPTKRGRGVCPSYKPSALANEDRVITAFALDASNENKVVNVMLDQSERVIGTEIEELLLDAGYFEDSVIAAALERNISILCPEGRTPEQPKAGPLFHKSLFAFDEKTLTYRCPAGQIMIKIDSCSGEGKTRKYDLYGGVDCSNCPMLGKCTKAKKGRTIKRYPEDEQRDALRVVMEHPQARKIFRQRKAMIEPVFSHLRGQQGLNRFRRTGLSAVTREFALHAMAHNLSRAVALLAAIFTIFFAAIALYMKDWGRKRQIQRNFGVYAKNSAFFFDANKYALRLRW